MEDNQEMEYFKEKLFTNFKEAGLHDHLKVILLSEKFPPQLVIEPNEIRHHSKNSKEKSRFNSKQR